MYPVSYVHLGTKLQLTRYGVCPAEYHCSIFQAESLSLFLFLFNFIDKGMKEHKLGSKTLSRVEFDFTQSFYCGQALRIRA